MVIKRTVVGCSLAIFAANSSSVNDGQWRVRKIGGNDTIRCLDEPGVLGMTVSADILSFEYRLISTRKCH